MNTLPDSNYKSFLADAIRDYLDYLDSLGYCIEPQAANLKRIDGFLTENNIHSLQQCDNRLWLQLLERHQSRVKGSTLRSWRSSFNGLCRYLVRQGWLSQNPVEAFDVPPLQNYRPYVFTIEELRRFFTYLQTQAEHYANERASFRFRSRYALYHLLYACGLRASECVHLQISDYAAAPRTLFIRPSKFHKDRLIPIGSRAAANLESLLELRQRLFGIPLEGFMFLSLPQRRPYTAAGISNYFREAMQHLGIYRRAVTHRNYTYGTPHLHELRRAFAVHRLMRWYREQADVDNKLPLLATYMGHVRFEYTKTYLTLTQQLLSEAGHRFARRFDRLDWMPHDPKLG
jgi:site-specific recombinase XerD